MANIFTSSIGKKLIMSISGLFLILFMFIHAFVNALSLISDEAFDAGCEFMALPIVTVMVPVLAAGFIVHIVYAFILNYMNLKARGPQRYAVANKAKTDDWASKNMLVLGIIVLGVMSHRIPPYSFLGKNAVAYVPWPRVHSRWCSSSTCNIQTSLGCYSLYRLVCCPLVAYQPWFLERIAYFGSQQQHLDETLESCKPCYLNNPCSCFHRCCS